MTADRPNGPSGLQFYPNSFRFPLFPSELDNLEDPWPSTHLFHLRRELVLLQAVWRNGEEVPAHWVVELAMTLEVNRFLPPFQGGRGWCLELSRSYP